MPIIKQGTTVIMVGALIKTSDGYTRSNTQALTTAKVKLSKNAAALANKACTKASCVSTHGMYRVFLSTVDSGTPGLLKVSVAATACLPWEMDYNVIPVKPWNSIFVGSDNLEVDVVQYNGAATTLLTTGDLDAAVAGVSTFSSGQVDAALVAFVGTTEWNDAIADLSTLSTADLDDAVSGLSTISTGDIDLGLQTFVGSTEWDDAIGGLSTLSTADLDTALSAYGACTDAISSRLPTALTSDGYIKADAIMVNGETPKGTTDVADVILLTPANLLRTDTQGNVKITTAARAEPGQGAPPVNADMALKADYLYKSWRNKKTQDSSTWSLYNDAGAVVDQKATISDDGSTATFGEIGSGA